MNTTKHYSGSCLCGKVTFEINGTLSNVGHCHCGMCQRWHGGAYGSYAKIDDADSFKLTAGAEHFKTYKSSAEAARGFCSNCGSSLSGNEGNKPVYICITALTGDAGIKPEAHIFVGSKADWEVIGDGLPQFDTWPGN